LDLSQKAGEIAFYILELEASSGTWITEGFTEGDILGQMTANDDRYDLKVRSSEENSLIIDVMEEDSDEEDDPEYVITISTGTESGLEIEPFEYEYSLELLQDIALTIDFSVPIFRLPESTGTSVDFDLTVFSMPERTGFIETSFQIEGKYQFVTN
jgi:hypothetical protein